MNRVGTSIDIDGVKQTVNALRGFKPEVYRRMNREIRKAFDKTKARAGSKYPGGDWTVRLTQKKLLGSIMATPGTRVDNKWGASSPGVKAAIFEFAGSVQPGATPQARGLIASLNSRYGQPGRFLWSAWDETGAEALDEIRGSLQRAERELQASLDAIGESY